MRIKLKPIDHQVVVVVGATSGIGRETALRFAKKGAKVVAAGRSEDALNSLVQEIQLKGGEALAVPADAADYEQMRQLAERAATHFGRIDTWVHAAAVSMYAPFEQTSPQEFEQIVRVNLLGQVHGAMAALPHLKREGQGALIHISSVESQRAMPYHSAYAASKHGMTGFLDALRLELQKENTPISVTNVMPAGINTPFFEKSLTRLGVQPRPLPPVYEPKVAADAILYAAEHPIRDVFAGGAARDLVGLQALSPRLADWLLKKVAFRLQKTNQPRSESDPHNLYGHAPGKDRVRGEFGREALPVSWYPFWHARPFLRLAITAAGLGAAAYFVARNARSEPRSRIRRMVENGAKAGVLSRFGRKPSSGIRGMLDRMPRLRRRPKTLVEKLRDRIG
jgi:NAD(P)-dependent dehydrogenase (short-subunit alcohol dehydrogenase family)